MSLGCTDSTSGAVRVQRGGSAAGDQADVEGEVRLGQRAAKFVENAGKLIGCAVAERAAEHLAAMPGAAGGGEL